MVLTRRRVRAAVAVAVVLLLAGCGPAGQAAPRKTSTMGHATAGTRPPSTRSPAAVTPSPVASASPRPPASPSALPVAPGAGQLPQTSALPSTDTAAFQNAMADLWLAVTTGDAGFGLPAFFPLAAYQKLKDLYEPTEDWRGRLWADFTLDVAAAHRQLREDGDEQAQFVQVIVPAAYAAWVSPGACANYIGYWHVPGARLVYRQDGQERSIGIASLISWRGDWYVVHLGAVLREAADDPEAGPGVPGPPGGC
jgi:hypothetical protein